MTLSGNFPDMPQAYGRRRDVTDGFIAPGGALERMFEVDGQWRELWIQDKSGKGIFKRLDLVIGWYNDVTSVKNLIGSSIVFSCELILIVRSCDLPRRPSVNELVHCPRNQVWQIVQCDEIREFYQIGLNRASTS
jgi:hypothetical protein